MALTYDSLFNVTTSDDFSDYLADAITSKEVILAHLNAKGFKKERDGGYNIVEQIMYAKHNQAKSYSQFGVINVVPQDPFTAARYAWKQVACPMTFSGLQKFQNSGSKHQIIDLIDAFLEHAEVSLSIEVARQIMLDGTGNGSLDITGLAAAVEDGAAWSTYGGIDSNTYTWWRNQFTGTVGSFAANGVDSMLTIYNNCMRGKLKPTIIVTDQNGYEAYEKSLYKLERITVGPDKSLSDLGFDSLLYKQTPIVFDTNCTAGYMYFLNADTLRWNVASGNEFRMTPLQQPYNQDAQSRLVLLYAQISLNNRARNGVLTGLTYP